ncbi:UNVERIFIED_CONTAM: hypothetical protein Sindi_1273500, partial [Sesamum indicum]
LSKMEICRSTSIERKLEEQGPIVKQEIDKRKEVKIFNPESSPNEEHRSAFGEKTKANNP